MSKKNEQTVNRNDNVDWSNSDGSDINQYASLRDKWNAIQEEYIEKYEALDTIDLYFESGGFEGLLGKISEVIDKPIEDIRSEIQNW